MGPISLLTLMVTLVSLMPIPNVADSAGDVYWKLKLGNDTPMPKIVKDSLIGSDANAKTVLRHMRRKGFPLTEELESSIRKDAEIEMYKKSFKVTNIDLTKHSVYFIENDLTHPGKSLKLNFIKAEDEATFLPPQVSESVPFTSTKLPEILNIFSVRPKSSGAEIMEGTIKSCETKAMAEEMKICATTLESMVDYVVSHVGSNNVSTLSGYVEKNIQNVHRITSAKKIKTDASMVCHKMGYPYSVFYCHTLKETNLYKVSMVDSEGEKMDANAVCHKDTSSWSPMHISFQILKVKAGSVPVCHFLNERSIAYFRN